MTATLDFAGWSQRVRLVNHCASTVEPDRSLGSVLGSVWLFELRHFEQSGSDGAVIA